MRQRRGPLGLALCWISGSGFAAAGQGGYIYDGDTSRSFFFSSADWSLGQR